MNNRVLEEVTSKAGSSYRFTYG